MNSVPPALVLAVLAGSVPPASTRAVENVTMAVRVLQLRNPEIAWREPPVRADFTGDQLADLAIMGVDAGALVVAVMVGPVNGGSETIRLRWASEEGELSAECLRDATLASEDLDPARERDAGRVRALEQARDRGVKGLRLSARPCDVFHLDWDAPSRSLNWWR